MMLGRARMAADGRARRLAARLSLEEEFREEIDEDDPDDPVDEDDEDEEDADEPVLHDLRHFKALAFGYGWGVVVSPEKL
jgi:hypothetical protein